MMSVQQFISQVLFDLKGESPFSSDEKVIPLWLHADGCVKARKAIRTLNFKLLSHSYRPLPV
jgi:hypothetical protein